MKTDRKPLRVGFTDFRPYVWATEEGQPAGLAVDVLNEAARRTGQPITWVPIWGAEEALDRGQIDMYPLLTVTGNRLAKYRFSEYWWQNTMVLILRANQAFDATHPAGKQIGIPSRNYMVQLAHSLFPGAELVSRADMDPLIEDLCTGGIDGLFEDTRNIQSFLLDRPRACRDSRFTIVPLPGARLPLGTVSTPAAASRAHALYGGLDQVIADGTLTRLAAHYSLVTPEGEANLMKLLLSRQHNRVLSWAAFGLCAVMALLVAAGLRMRSAGLAAEEAQAALAEIEERFHAFMDNSPAVAYMKDAEGRMVYVNHAYGDIILSAKERLGKTDSETLPQVVAEPLRANDRKVLESNQACQFVESIEDHGGVTQNWLSFKFPFRDRSGEVFLGGVSFEITGMVQAQQALKESEARYRQIVEYAGDMILRCDGRGVVTYCNEVGARVLKMPASRVCGRRALRFVVPSYRRLIMEKLRRSIDDGMTDLYAEAPVIAGDGSRLWLGQTIRVLRNTGGVSGFQSISRDITERKRMEAELRSSEERFRVLYENGPVAYHEIDRQGVIRRVNRAECEMLGTEALELIGRPVSDLIAPEERELSRAAIEAKMSGQKALHPFQRTYMHRDGRAVRVEVHENLLRDEAGVVIGMHSVLLDVTQQYQAHLLERDRTEICEMIAGQQPLEQILAAISAMISHQDGSLRCVTMRLENQRLEMSQQGQNEAPGLCQALRDASGEAAEIWPLTGFHVSHMAIAELENRPGAAAVAREARRMGFESCWSVPVISSSQFPMGLLLVFSPRLEKPADPERQLIEASGRTAAIAIEHRYLSDLLAFQAAHDSLTGLANRSSFDDSLRKAIACAESCGEQLAVLYVDLDRFKEVNDRFGHSTGDELLRQVAARLRKCTRHSDVLARFGGDEFTMLLQGLREKAESKRVAGAVLDAFQTPFQLENNLSLRVTASIGISIYPRDGADAATLESNSDIAMYRVKASGRNNFHSYDGDGSPKPELVA